MQGQPSRNCRTCSKTFYKRTNCSLKEWTEQARFCSRSCAMIGKTPWNKGTKGRMAAWNKGKPFSKSSRLKMSIAKTGKPWTESQRAAITTALPKGKDHHNWKGDAVGYTALHAWVKRQLGKATRCENCGLTTKPRLTSRGKPMRSKKSYFEWSNISGKYLRDLSDWRQLCVKCHSKHDRNSLTHSLTTPNYVA